jgi:hypothetical protein
VAIISLPATVNLTAVQTLQKATPDQVYGYQRCVGSIQYSAAITRPDITKASSLLAEFSVAPAAIHYQAVNQALRHLSDTRNLVICYNSNHRPVFKAYSDASLGDDMRTRKSSQGYVIKLFGGAIDWRANRQKTVANSTTNTEFNALADATSEVLR